MVCIRVARPASFRLAAVAIVNIAVVDSIFLKFLELLFAPTKI